MNTRKQVLIMSALLMMMLVITGVYAAWYPSRAEDSEEHFKEATAERGAILFANNCRICHGNLGEGGALAGRLAAAPPLDRPDLQGFADSGATLSANVTAAETTLQTGGNAAKLVDGSLILIDEERMIVDGKNSNLIAVERGEGHTEAASHASGAVIYLFDKAAFDDISVSGLKKRITNTITCGRLGTAMPAWAQSQGGSLSDEQIRQLMTLITEDRWDLVLEDINGTDPVVDLLSAKLLEPLSGDSTRMRVSDTSVFSVDQVLRVGDERIQVKEVPKPAAVPAGSPTPTPVKDKSGTLVVERGVFNTTPLDHSVDEKLYNYDKATTPSINAATCGQTAKAAPPPGKPELVEPFTGQTVTVIAQNVAYDVKEIRVQTGGQIRVRLDNRDNGTDHNIAFYPSATSTTAPLTPDSIGLTFAGVAVDDTVFTIPAAGTYYFRCDVHPTIPAMSGSFVVTP